MIKVIDLTFVYVATQLMPSIIIRLPIFYVPLITHPYTPTACSL